MNSSKGRLALAITLALIVSACAVAVGAPSDDREQATPPNILLVVADDQPTGMVKRMPFLDHAGGFTRFDAFYNNNPLCCPSRSTMLTGLYSHHTGVETNLVARRFDASSTLATWLDAGGYETGLFGKYLNDYPWDKGRNYVPAGWDQWHAFAGDASYYDYTLVSADSRRQFGHRPGDYSTDVLAKLTAGFLGNANGPFFAYFAPYGPHAPRIPAPRDRKAFEHAHVGLPANFNRIAKRAPRWWRDRPPLDPDEMREETRAQWQTLLSVDDAIKRFFSVLERTGKLDHTIVIFVSDNGYSLGSHRNPWKDCAYEECIHVPLLVRWPGESTPSRIAALTSNVDLAPTIAEIAGVTPTTAPDGTSLVPLLRGDATTIDRPVLLRHVHYPHTAPTFWGLRTQRWTYVAYDNGEQELYDLDADPHELRNLAGLARYRSVESELSREMGELRGG